jgi:GDP-4-dehydro-6-deoxy-D-mannose reductase
MRILVTGASGFVGRHMVRHIAAGGDEPVAWGRSQTAGETLRRPDLLDDQAVRQQDLAGIDAVIHLAGLAQVSDSFARPAEYVSANSAMQINLMEALLEQRSFPRVLIVSTGGVYKGGAELITETSLTASGNPYTVSKLTQELLAWYYAQRGFAVIVARPFNHIGPGQGRGYLVADLASQIATSERDGDGGVITVGNLSSSRDYTDVRDVVAAYHRLVESGRPGEIYNVCRAQSYTGQAILTKLAALADRQITVATDAKLARPTDTSTVTASNAKLTRDTGWAPTISLDDTLADVLDYWRTRVSAAELPQ